MANIFDEIRRLQQEINILEEDYNESLEKFKERREIIRQSDIFGDLESLYFNKGSLEDALGLVSISDDNYDRSRNFYEKFSFVWKYIIKYADNIIEATDENIYSLGHYVFDDVEGIFTPEELDTVRCGINDIDEMTDDYEPKFYLLTTVHPVYKIVAICLRLESLGFRDIYELEQDCSKKSADIEELKSLIKEYKIEIGKKLIVGGLKKSEQTINTVIKPKVRKGIKKLTKKIIEPFDSDEN